MNIKKKASKFAREHLVTLKYAPVEMTLALYLFVLSLLSQHEGIPSSYEYDYIQLAPLFLIIPLLFNKWFPSGRLRILYYLSALIIIPFWWINTREWLGTPSYFITIIISVLALFSCGWPRENHRFTENTLRYVWDGTSAVVLTGIAYLLLLAIFYSIVYIFDIFHDITGDFSNDAASLLFIVLQPLVFLTLNRNAEQREWKFPKLLDTLLNWVLSPAVLIYTALLYLYFAKIVITWTLPRGGIAYLVFGFTLIATAAQALQTLMNKSHYDWFYKHFSLISLPALLMFWVGVANRWNEYGLTENRVYLIACGLIMTACIGLFFSPKTGRYLYVTLFAIITLAVFTYIPGLTARDLEARSQKDRPEKRRNQNDLMQHTAQQELSCLTRKSSGTSIDLRGYKRLYEPHNWNTPDNGKMPYATNSNDTLTLYDASDRILLREAFVQILEKQLAKIGRTLTDTIPHDTLEFYAPQLLEYQTDKGKIIFETMDFSHDSLIHLTHVSIKYYLEK